jgi:hypothetical protein
MKGYPKVFIEGIIFLGTLYILPPYAIAQTMSQLQYHLYCDAMGISVSAAAGSPQERDADCRTPDPDGAGALRRRPAQGHGHHPWH